MIDLNELEQFLVFYKNGTLSGAAAELHISQPTLPRLCKNWNLILVFLSLPAPKTSWN